MNSPITTHVLDTHLGKPAEGLTVTLFKSLNAPDQWDELATGQTNADGRITDWLPGQRREAGLYKIIFETQAYFEKLGTPCFYPRVTIEFHIQDPEQHYHVPLLISAHGLSTYRGS
jgi:5-hydroxyisourate hydrolase